MKRIVQWGLLIAVVTVGTFAFLFLCGEDSPDNPLTVGQFFIIKAGAISTLYGCYQFGKFLYKNDMLPKSVIDELGKEDEI